MTPDDRTRLVSPAENQARPLPGDDTVDRPDDGTQPSVRVVAGSTDPSATMFRATESQDAEPIVPAFEHYHLLGQLGRGGMGVVYRALDTRLKRDVAIKVLSERMVGNPTAERRFEEEALVTGQLTHTAIPPVHELGRLPDGRQFLVMKLIKGNTLGEQLKARPNPSADLVTHLVTLEQVCQGVGYAHSRGVIHRDLKPANIMVGAFREVLVMDWGLAKEVRTADHPRESDTASPGGDEPPRAVNQTATPDTLLREVRSPDDDITRAGTILGTPPYMSPEQATGDLEAVDVRTDVFSLGAILCVILTGQPPYTGKTANEVVLKAINWETADAFRRLGHSTADPLVVDLCKRCLAKDPAHRPANGEAVAAELAEIRATAAERLRRADLSEMARLAKRQELKRRRRWQIGLGAAVACNVAVIAAAGWYVSDQRRQARDDAKAREDKETEAEEELTSLRQKVDAELTNRQQEEIQRAEAKRAEREAAIRGALEQVTAALGQVKVADTAASWDQTLSRARTAQGKAEEWLKEDPTSALAPRVQDSAVLFQKANADRELTRVLDSITADVLERDGMGGRDPRFAERYQTAFRKAGLPDRDPDGFVKRVNEHPFPTPLVEAVFYWHDHATGDDRKAVAALRSRLVAGQPFAFEWCAATTDTGPSGTKAMVRLSAGEPAGRQPAWLILRLFRDLWCRGEREAAARVMRAGLARQPSEYRLHARFARSLALLDTPATRLEAIAHATAANAMTSSKAMETLLGRLYAEHGQYAEALLHLDRVGDPVELMAVYRALGQWQKAEEERGKFLGDSNGEKRLALVRARWAEGDRKAAVNMLKTKVLPTKLTGSEARLNLTRTYRLLGMLDEAEAECNNLFFIDSRWPSVHLELAHISEARAEADPAHRLELLRAAQRQLADAATQFPQDLETLTELARVSALMGDGKKAVEAGQKAVKLCPAPDPSNRSNAYSLVDAAKRHADALWVLGFAHLTAGNPADAADAAKRLVETAPKDPRGPALMGQVAATGGDWAEAVRQGELAVRLDDDNAELWNQLGRDHQAAGDRAKATRAFAEAVSRAPDSARYQWDLAAVYLRSWDKRGVHHLANAFAAAAAKAKK